MNKRAKEICNEEMSGYKVGELIWKEAQKEILEETIYMIKGAKTFPSKKGYDLLLIDLNDKLMSLDTISETDKNI